MWNAIGEFICGWGGTILACAGLLYLGVLAWIGAGHIGDGTSRAPSPTADVEECGWNPSTTADAAVPLPLDKGGLTGNGGDGE